MKSNQDTCADKKYQTATSNTRNQSSQQLSSGKASRKTMPKLVYTTKSGGLQRNKTSSLYDTTPAKILKYVRKHPLTKPESSSKTELRKDKVSLSGQSHQFFTSSTNIDQIQRVSCHSTKSDANKSFENN